MNADTKLVVTGLFSLRSQNWLRLLKSCTKVDDYAWSLALCAMVEQRRTWFWRFLFFSKSLPEQAVSTQCHL